MLPCSYPFIQVSSLIHNIIDISDTILSLEADLDGGVGLAADGGRATAAAAGDADGALAGDAVFLLAFIARLAWQG